MSAGCFLTHREAGHGTPWGFLARKVSLRGRHQANGELPIFFIKPAGTQQMKKHMTSLFYAGVAVFGFNQSGLANNVTDNSLATHSLLLHSVDQEAGQQPVAPIILAAGVDTRVERRSDAVENTADRIDDKQDFREERRDCVGDGPDCRSDNRQDKRQDTVDRAEDRVDDRRDRR